MRLKEIKPYMAIRCENAEQVYELNKQMKSDKCFEDFLSFPCYILTDKNGFSGWLMACNKDFISSENYNPVPKIVEFSDLIIPEMSAEEVLQIVKKLEFEFVREYLGLPYGKSLNGMLFDAEPRKIIDMCEQWKSDHEKKDPEIETVDVCRIIEVLSDGRKRCVHEEDLASGSTDAEIKILVEAELKRYCMEHDGEYIAVHEVVSRVKAVE